MTNQKLPRARRGAGALVLLGLALSLSAWSRSSSPSRPPGRTAPASTVTLALDWTPNTDHTGFYVAESLGYYKKAGIRLQILPFNSTAPDVLVSAGRADFGISFQSEVAEDETQGLAVTSVMAILQHMADVVGFRPGSGITRPAQLAGKTFAWDGGTDEIPTIEYLIRRDGGRATLPDGKPNFKVVDLSTSAYDAVYSGRADFDWPLRTWEVVQARLEGKPMGYFDLQKWGVPDDYEVLLIGGNSFLRAHPGLASRFVRASAEGFTYAAHHPDRAARILVADNPGVFNLPELVYDSARLMARSYWLDPKGAFGVQGYAKWDRYTKFEVSAGILTNASGKVLHKVPTDISSWFTNRYLEGRAP